MFYGLAISFERYPRLSAVMLILAVVGPILLVIFGPRPESPEAYDRAHLECRQSGGSFEYFGTQGYVCIPPRNQDGGSVR